PSNGDGEALVSLEFGRGTYDDLARLLGDNRGLACGRALRAGIECPLEAERHPLGQANPYLGAFDRKSPTVTGHVPVELVVAVEEAELAGSGVPDDVCLDAVGNKHIGVADAHAKAVRDTFQGIGLKFTVALDGTYVEIDTHAAAITLVDRREVAIDAAADLVAFYVDPDC